MRGRLFWLPMLAWMFVFWVVSLSLSALFSISEAEGAKWVGLWACNIVISWTLGNAAENKVRRTLLRRAMRSED